MDGSTCTAQDRAVGDASDFVSLAEPGEAVPLKGVYK
jgi:hypothetical protein